jgi:hypothetical protein
VGGGCGVFQAKVSVSVGVNRYVQNYHAPLPYYTPPLSESVVSEMHVRTKFCYRQAITSCKYTENSRGVQLEGGYSRGGGYGTWNCQPL